MKIKLLSIWIILLFGVISISLHAQEQTVTAGGIISGNGGNISYTVGSMVSNSYTGTSGSISQGIQQPYEIFVISGIEETNVNVEISAFPNPVKDYITIKTNTEDYHHLSFHLYDINGKLLTTKKIEKEATLSLVNYPASAYYINIFNNNIKIKTFKIIKN